MPFAASIDDRAGEVRQRELALDGAAFEGDARHAVDERARLVLAERAGARLAHLQQPLGPVLAHAGEDHPDGLGAHGARARAEKNVHRGTVAGDRRPVVEPADEADALTNDLEMMGAGRDIDAARLDALIVRRLADRHRAFAVEAA